MEAKATKVTKEELKDKIIKLADKLICGSDTNSGMENCLDGYYHVCFAEDLAKYHKLKEQLNQTKS